MRVAKEYSIRNEKEIKIISFLHRIKTQSTVAEAPSVSDWGVSPPFPLQHPVLQACLTVEADGLMCLFALCAGHGILTHTSQDWPSPPYRCPSYYLPSEEAVRRLAGVFGLTTTLMLFSEVHPLLSSALAAAIICAHLFLFSGIELCYVCNVPSWERFHDTVFQFPQSWCETCQKEVRHLLQGVRYACTLIAGIGFCANSFVVCQQSISSLYTLLSQPSARRMPFVLKVEFFLCFRVPRNFALWLWGNFSTHSGFRLPGFIFIVQCTLIFIL